MKIHMKRKLAVVLLICISCHLGWAAQDFVWKSGQNMKVVCDTTEAPVVKVALDLLKRDCRSVLSGDISVRRIPETFMSVHGEKVPCCKR